MGTSGQTNISFITCVINVCHIVALCRLAPVVVNNAEKSELARIKINKIPRIYCPTYLYCRCLVVYLFLLAMLRMSLGISRSTLNSTAFITFWQPPVVPS